MAVQVGDLAGVGAAVAAAVALFVPFVQDKLRQREDARRLHGEKAEILSAIEDAIRIYQEAGGAIADAFRPGHSDLRIRDIEERALRARRVIRLLVKRPGLSDGIIRCALDGAALALETAKAVQLLYGGKFQSQVEASRALQFNRVRLERTYSEMMHLRSRHRVPRDPRLPAIQIAP